MGSSNLAKMAPIVTLICSLSAAVAGIVGSFGKWLDYTSPFDATFMRTFYLFKDESVCDDDVAGFYGDYCLKLDVVKVTAIMAWVCQLIFMVVFAVYWKMKTAKFVAYACCVGFFASASIGVIAFALTIDQVGVLRRQQLLAETGLAQIDTGGQWGLILMSFGWIAGYCACFCSILTILTQKKDNTNNDGERKWT